MSEFMEASEKLDIVQKKVRDLAKQDERIARQKQMELFSADEHVTDERDDMDLSEVKEYLQRCLRTVFGVGVLNRGGIVRAFGIFHLLKHCIELMKNSRHPNYRLSSKKSPP